MFCGELKVCSVVRSTRGNELFSCFENPESVAPSVTIVTESFQREIDLCFLIEGFMKRQRFVIIAILLAVAAIVTALGFRKIETVEERPSSQMVNSNNQPVDFADLEGKVLFVNNWASWCPPCIAEMPSIQALKTKLKGVDVQFVMVSFDDDKTRAQNFVTKRKFDFDIYFPGQQYPFATSSIPATFIIGKNGKIIAEHVGMADYSSDEIVNQLKALANE